MKKQEMDIRKCICGKEGKLYNIGKSKMVACHHNAGGCGRSGSTSKTSTEAIARWNEMMKHRLNPMTMRDEVVKHLQMKDIESAQKEGGLIVGNTCPKLQASLSEKSYAGRIKIGHVPDVTIIGYGKNVKGVGKVDMNLLLVDMSEAVYEVCEVMTHGAMKHEPCGWKKVDNGIGAYTNALNRHLNAEARGEVIDKEFNKHHAAHAACSALIRLQLIIDSEKKGKG
jgi:hypothetical protein